ncbi:MAG: hypothetical protein V3W44_08630 [Dehalococcoidales bacterium]
MFTSMEEKVLMTAQAMTADRTSSTVDAKTIVSMTIACTITSGSSPVGDLVLQLQTATSGGWKEHTRTGITADGDTLFEILDPSGLFYRVFYDFTSGTGTLDIEVSARIHKRRGDVGIEPL